MPTLNVKASCDDCQKVGRPTEMLGPLTLAKPMNFEPNQTMAYAYGDLLPRMGQHAQIAANSTEPDAPSHSHWTVSTTDGKKLGTMSPFEQEQGISFWLDESASDLRSELRAEIGFNPPNVESGR